MTDCVAAYRRKVKRRLRCGWTAKGRLMEDFDRVLSSFRDDHPNPTPEQLILAFGGPEVMAEELMRDVNKWERAAYRREQWAIRIVAAILAMLLVIMGAYHYIERVTPIYEYNSIIEGNTVVVPKD